jgi:hypothetical protein
MPSQRQLAQTLVRHFGPPFADELGIELESNTPSPLFRWLCACLLFSARIGHGQATSAARALNKAGWTTAQKMADSTWEQRVKTLNRSGYARYDESTARMLGDTAGLLLDRYGGDLRKLREAAERDPARERKLLKEFKGLGDVGVDIFFREAQIAWDELYPFADRRALKTAKQLGLPADAKRLARLVSQRELPTLASALARVALDKQLDAVREQAAA